MRTFLIAAFAALALAAPAGAATRNFGITGFEKVRVEGPFKVSLTTGVAPFARATGSPPRSTASRSRSAATRWSSTATSSWGGYPGPERRAGRNQPRHPRSDRGLAERRPEPSRSTGSAACRSTFRSRDRARSRSGRSTSISSTSAWSAPRAPCSPGAARKVTAVVRGISSARRLGPRVKDATIGAEGAATDQGQCQRRRHGRRQRPERDHAHRPPGLHLAAERLGQRQRLPLRP